MSSSKETSFLAKKLANRCQECRSFCRAGTEVQHIFQVHIKKKMYKCPFCQYDSQCDSNVNRHISSKHAELSFVGSIDQRDQFVEELTDWRVKCFGQTTRKKRSLVASDYIVCRKCNSNVIRFRKLDHLRRTHMEWLYHCSVCAYANGIHVNVKCHIARAHADHQNARVLKNSEKFNAEADRLARECFATGYVRLRSTGIPLGRPSTCNNLSLPSENRDTDAKVENNGNPNQCQLCGFEESVSRRRAQHVIRTHMRSLFQSSVCEFKNGSAATVLRHLRTSRHRHEELAEITKNKQVEGQFRNLMLKAFPSARWRRSSDCDTAEMSRRTVSRATLKEITVSSSTPRQGALVCTKCQTEIRRKNVKQHTVDKHMSPQYHCSLCEVRYRRIEELRRHFSTTHPDAQHPTYQQLKATFDMVTYMNVMVECFPDRSGKIAGKIKTNISTGVQKVQCKKCSENVPVQFSSQHVRSHFTTPVFRCPICANSGNRLSQVQDHIGSMHPDDKYDGQSPEPFILLSAADCNRLTVECFGAAFLVPEKRKEAVRCKECTARVPPTELSKHVYERHFPPMFCCSVCDFKSTSENCVERHLKGPLHKDVEKDALAVINRMQEYREQFCQVIAKCFPSQYQTATTEQVDSSAQPPAKRRKLGDDQVIL
jgi:hypothetical protein